MAANILAPVPSIPFKQSGSLMPFQAFSPMLAKGSPIAVPLQAVGLLSALIFLISCLFEVMVINGMYEGQHVLLSLLLMSLSIWAIVEIQLVVNKRLQLPIRALRIVLVAQLLVIFVRGFADLTSTPHSVSESGLAGGPQFGFAFVFLPVYLALFMMISRLIINAFSYAEFLRANQLQLQMVALEQAKQALQLSEERYRLITEWVEDVIWTLDGWGCYSYLSPSIEKLTGLSPEAFLHQPLAAGLADHSAQMVVRFFEDSLALQEAGLSVEPFRAELELLRQDRPNLWCEVTMTGLYGPERQFIGYVGVTRDISERKTYEVELRDARDAAETANLALLSANAVLHGQATTDPLTGVSNRRHFEQVIEVQIAQSRRFGESLSLAIIDIDDFKSINDRFGHQMGDLVLVALVRLLRAQLRKGQLLARWGGDEFVVMLPHTSAEEARQLAERLRLAISVHVFPVMTRLTGSFGVAGLQAQESSEDLFARVDGVLYAAKAAGRDQVKLSE